MNMFQTFLASIPSNRSEMVNDLEIPDIPLTPYIWEPDPISISDSSLETVTLEDYEARTRRSLSTDSSIPLSRAMTDSEFDYDWYRRYKRLDLSDPWEQMRIGWAAFPPEHIATLNSLTLDTSTADITDSPPPSIPFEPFPSQEFLRKIDRFLEDECCVFGPDDPAILELEEALRDVDLEDKTTKYQKQRCKFYLKIYIPERVLRLQYCRAIRPEHAALLQKPVDLTQELLTGTARREWKRELCPQSIESRLEISRPDDIGLTFIHIRMSYYKEITTSNQRILTEWLKQTTVDCIYLQRH